MDRLTNALENVIKEGEKKARPPADPPIGIQMALGGYTEILLKDSGIFNSPYPNQFVGLNGYQCVLPREIPILVSDFIAAELDRAEEGYEHEVVNGQTADGRPNYVPVRVRRPNLNYRTIRRNVTPQEAHALRATRRGYVFPEQLDPEAQAAIEALMVVPDIKKGK